jgi:hypothetical protein
VMLRRTRNRQRGRRRAGRGRRPVIGRGRQVFSPANQVADQKASRDRFIAGLNPRSGLTGPMRHFIKLCGTQAVNSGTITTGTGYHPVLKGNGAFDPWGSSGTAQFPGFDANAALYNNYRVHRSALSVKADVIGSAITAKGIFTVKAVMYPALSATGAGTITTAIGWPMSKQQEIACAAINGDAGPTYETKSINLMHACSTTQLLAQDNIDSSPDLQALVTADPLTTWYWHIHFDSPNSGLTSFSVQIIYTMTYWIEFYAPAPANDAIAKARRMLENELKFRTYKAEQKQKEQDKKEAKIEEDWTIEEIHSYGSMDGSGEIARLLNALRPLKLQREPPTPHVLHGAGAGPGPIGPGKKT